MQIALYEFKNNVSKYINIATNRDVVITKHGTPAVKIIRFDKELWQSKEIPENIDSIEQLFGTLPSDINLDEVKKGRLLE